jgi:hypothetical protein
MHLGPGWSIQVPAVRARSNLSLNRQRAAARRLVGEALTVYPAPRGPGAAPLGAAWLERCHRARKKQRLFAKFSIMLENAAIGTIIQILVRLGIAGTIYSLLTIGVDRTRSNTVDQGRRVGAMLAAVVVFTQPTASRPLADIVYMYLLVAIPLFLLGFSIGAVYHRVRARRQSSSTDEELWEIAATELQSDQRNVGLWARCYAEAAGNESVARANYLKSRVKQLKKRDKR